jgi:hypothetical protein
LTLRKSAPDAANRPPSTDVHVPTEG